jgi:hypothetical protein
LRNGDIVATNEGFVAYNGGDRRHAEFTPIQNHRGLSSEVRRQLSQTRIAPSNATRVSPEAIRERAAAIHDNRQVQDNRRVHVR